MAKEDHLLLSQFIKDVHLSLRESSSSKGAENAWLNHCEKKDLLVKYAMSMEKLATTHWQRNCADTLSEATSRIEWTANFCLEYFIKQNWLRYREKELSIASKISLAVEGSEQFSDPLKLIDVGSCYNPFKKYDFLDVFAIDLCPANNYVLECDFLTVFIGSDLVVKNKIVEQLPQQYFDIVTFCFVLEYIPDSDLRIKACEKAYSILKPGGLLIINTPDSKHVGANAKLMKCWRYTLAQIGFNRIKYEKFRHMHCMAFRRSLHKDIAARWAHLHQEPYMKFAINIPQDFQKCETKNSENKIEDLRNGDDFKELPFVDHEEL